MGMVCCWENSGHTMEGDSYICHTHMCEFPGAVTSEGLGEGEFWHKVFLPALCLSL